MKFCSNCGQQIEDNTKFCPHCGSSQVTSQPFVPGGKHLHCPKCKGVNLSPIVETDVQGGFAVNRSVGRKWGASAVDLKSTHRNYWVCGQCGHKFRNIDSLEEEIAVQTKAQHSCISLSIIMLLLSLLLLLTDGGMLIILVIPVLILLVCLWFWIRNKVIRLTEEKNYLEANCFN